MHCPRMELKNLDKDQLDFLVSSLGISGTLARLLVNRGISFPAQASQFLNPDIANLYSPHLMAGMATAVNRIVRAINNNEEILVYGDYDVDGISSAALLCRFLRRWGACVQTYIPNRETEGYGLNWEALTKELKRGFSLVITVDCGITGHREIVKARELGVDFIVTDHHQVAEELPAALAVLNPKRKDCNYPFTELAGVGIAFKLCQGILLAFTGGEIDEGLLELLPFVAMGTVADLVPLIDENRIIVREGLARLSHNVPPGLQALMECAGITDEVNVWHIAFLLGPRLNAAGRLADARLALGLLTTDDPRKGKELAIQLQTLNQRRQDIEQRLVEEAQKIMEREKESMGLLIAGGEGWHQGVIGIAASRLVEKFYRPVLLVTFDGAEARGSGRSIPGFNLFHVLKNVAHHFTRFGGHKMAVGFSLPQESYEAFKEELTIHARRLLTPDLLQPRLKVDGELRLGDLRPGLVTEIEKLAPFGLGNPRPSFYLNNVKITHKRQVGSEAKHLQLMLKDKKDGNKRKGIGFNLGEEHDRLETSNDYGIVGQPRMNYWQGREEVQLEIQHIFPAEQFSAPEGDREPLALPGDIFLSDSLEQGRQCLFGRLQGIGRRGVYIVPTCFRAVTLYRALQNSANDTGWKLAILTGLTPPRYRISAKDPVLYITTITYMQANPKQFISPEFIAWEGPFFDFPHRTYYNGLVTWVNETGFNGPVLGLDFFNPPPWLKIKGSTDKIFSRHLDLNLVPVNNRDAYLQKIENEALVCVRPQQKKLIRGAVAYSSPIVTFAAKRLFFYDPPVQGGEVLYNLDRIQNGCVDIVDWSQNGGLRQPHILMKLDRSFLVTLYRLLKRNAGREGWVDWTLLTKTGSYHEHILNGLGIRIFQELDLVEIGPADQKKGEKEPCSIRVKATGTVDLFRSMVYNEFVSERWAYIAWPNVSAQNLAAGLAQEV